MSPAVRHGDRVVELVRLAARWRLAGLLFRRPRPGWREEIESLAREAGDAGLDRAAAGTAAASEGRYLALLGPGGAVSPREVSYRPVEDPGRLLAEISAFHEAFAYRAGAEDPVDHVAVAADFVGFLALKEAYASGAGEDGDAETTRAARERFIERHVRATARGTTRRLEGIGHGCEYLTAAAVALGALAGIGTDAGGEEPLGDAPFLLPGLDGPFECGAVDASDCRAGGCLRPDDAPTESNRS